MNAGHVMAVPASRRWFCRSFSMWPLSSAQGSTTVSLPRWPGAPHVVGRHGRCPVAWTPFAQRQASTGSQDIGQSPECLSAVQPRLRLLHEATDHCQLSCDRRATVCGVVRGVDRCRRSSLDPAAVTVRSMTDSSDPSGPNGEVSTFSPRSVGASIFMVSSVNAPHGGAKLMGMHRSSCARSPSVRHGGPAPAASIRAGPLAGRLHKLARRWD